MENKNWQFTEETQIVNKHEMIHNFTRNQKIHIKNTMKYQSRPM